MHILAYLSACIHCGHTYLRGFSIRPLERCLLLLFEDSVEDVHQQRIEGIHVSLCADVTATAAGNALASQHPSALPTLQYNQTSVTKTQLQKQIHHNISSPDGIPIVVKLHRMMLFPLFCRVLPSAEVDPPPLQLLHSHSSTLKLYMVNLQECLYQCFRALDGNTSS